MVATCLRRSSGVRSDETVISACDRLQGDLSVIYAGASGEVRVAKGVRGENFVRLTVGQKFNRGGRQYQFLGWVVPGEKMRILAVADRDECEASVSRMAEELAAFHRMLRSRRELKEAKERKDHIHRAEQARRRHEAKARRRQREAEEEARRHKKRRRPLHYASDVRLKRLS